MMKILSEEDKIPIVEDYSLFLNVANDACVGGKKIIVTTDEEKS